MKLSIGMMVKNESKYLDRCLTSLKLILEKLEAEIIIVDTGSQDNTVEIAKKHTNKVYFHKWNNNFAEMRNIVLEYASGDWFFMLDGDEILENSEGVIEFFNSGLCDSYDAAYLTEKNITRETDESSYSIFYPIRFFKRDKEFHFEGAIHEQPKYKGPVGEINAVLLHYGYMSTDKDLMDRKFERTSKILLEELETNPENIYYWYQLAVTYGMHKDYREAIKPIEKAAEIIKKKKLNPANYIYVYTNRALTYFLNNKWIETEMASLEALKLNSKLLDMYYYLAYAQAFMFRDKEAINNYKTYLDILEELQTNKNRRDNSNTSYTIGKKENVYLDLALLYEKQEDYRNSVNFLNKIQRTDIIKTSLIHIIRLYTKMADYNGLKHYFDSNILNCSDVEELFILNLESFKSSCSQEEKEILIRMFSKLDSNYGLLNNIRLKNIEDKSEVDSEIIEKIKGMDLNNQQNYYGDIILYLMRTMQPLYIILKDLKEITLNMFFQYLSGNNEKLVTYILEYLTAFPAGHDFYKLRINKALERYALILNKEDDLDYLNLFNAYVKDGIEYLTYVYSRNIIENELTSELKTDEESFLLYMYHANTNRMERQVEYIRYLREALKVYPQMKNGIESLLEEVKNETDKNNELNKYKLQLKETISQFVNKNEIIKAKELISQYEDIIKNDIDILSIKAVIFILEGDLNQAKELLEEGLRIDQTNFDLLFNYAYVLETLGSKTLALSYYNRARLQTEDNDLIENINNIIRNINKY